MADEYHIFVELTDRKVRDAKMVMLDELRAEGWEPDPKGREVHVSTAWVQDVLTGEKLAVQPCQVWLLDNKVAAYVSVDAYPASKKIKPLFGFSQHVMELRVAKTS
jgi:hypothetical protein